MMEINGVEHNGNTEYGDLNLSPQIMRAMEKKATCSPPVQLGASVFHAWRDVIAKGATGQARTFGLRNTHGGAH